VRPCACIRLAVFSYYRPVANRHTDGRTRSHSIYRASMVSRGENSCVSQVSMTTSWCLLFLVLSQLASCHAAGNIVERLCVFDVITDYLLCCKTTSCTCNFVCFVNHSRNNSLTANRPSCNLTQFDPCMI